MPLLPPEFHAVSRYHASGGLRVALRSSILGVSLLLFVGGNAPDLLYTIFRFVLGLTSPRGGTGPLAILALVGFAQAVEAGSRIRTGMLGWLRSLPASGTTQRRALAWALVRAQLPVFVAQALAVAVTVLVYREPLSPAKLVALPLLALCSAAVVAPAARSWAVRALAVAAAWAALRASPGGVLLAAGLLAAAEGVAGPLRLERSRGRRGGRGGRGGRAALPLDLLLVWRALGWRVALAALPALLPLAGAYFFRANNPLPPATAALAARIGGAQAVVWFVAGLGNVLLRRRRPWVWARSLAWSSRRRVAADALALGLPALAWLPPVALMDPAAALVALCAIPLAAALAAGALRGGDERQTGAAGEALLVAAPAAVAAGVYPLLAPLCALLALPVLRLGARRERAQRVSRWSELHHHASSDASWMGAA